MSRVVKDIIILSNYNLHSEETKKRVKHISGSEMTNVDLHDSCCLSPSKSQDSDQPEVTISIFLWSCEM